MEIDVNPQVITTPAGERLVMLPEADYEALVSAAEDVSDRAAVAEFRRKLEAGEEELVAADVVNRILSGENRVKVWRSYRGMTMAALAGEAGISQPFLSQIESGKREGKLEVIRKLAEALKVSLDDLAG